VCRKFFAVDDANRRSHRRNLPDHIVQEHMSVKFRRGLVTPDPEAFAAGEDKSVDGWIG
jgi:hypothetical protein